MNFWNMLLSKNSFAVRTYFIRTRLILRCSSEENMQTSLSKLSKRIVCDENRKPSNFCVFHSTFTFNGCFRQLSHDKLQALDFLNVLVKRDNLVARRQITSQRNGTQNFPGIWINAFQTGVFFLLGEPCLHVDRTYLFQWPWVFHIGVTFVNRSVNMWISILIRSPVPVRNHVYNLQMCRCKKVIPERRIQKAKSCMQLCNVSSVPCPEEQVHHDRHITFLYLVSF